MPLSEDEQRILSEIEQQLYASDPALARDIREQTVYSVAFRQVKRAVLGFVLGLAFVLGTLHISFWLSLLGFVAMLVAALAIEANLRRMGKAGMDQLTRNMRAAGLRDAFGSTSQKMRDRFRRDEE